MGIGVGRAGKRMNNQKPEGNGPIWSVSYRRTNNMTFDILSVHPHNIVPPEARGQGIRHILVRAQDELGAVKEAIDQLDWLRS